MHQVLYIPSLAAPRGALVVAGLVALTAPTPATAQGDVRGAIELPAVFREDRVLVRPVTQAGDTLVFYTDTGGGINMIYAPTVERLGLTGERVAFGQDSVTLVPWPEWQAAASIPEPREAAGPAGTRLVVVPFSEQAAMTQDADDAGFLGRQWFAGRVWTFDYPAQKLLLHDPSTTAFRGGSATAPLGFQVDSGGVRTTHFPRIAVVVEGDSLDLLFDTGATMTLTASAHAALADGRDARRASSFISAAVFDGWRAEHPHWRVIEGATMLGADLIEVPVVEIAGEQVGPVWFESRPVGTFEEYMSQWMDRPILGALGGNALHHFRVTVDYPRAVATFERP